jgi:hypothetical protein
MTLDQMQEAYLKKMTRRNTRKKVPFVIGPKNPDSAGLGCRPHKQKGKNRFPSVLRSKNPIARYRGQLTLGKEEL